MSFAVLYPSYKSLEINHDFAFWLGAAYQHVALDRRLDRIGPIADGTGDERGLTIVADAGAARPSHGDIACLSQFEDALECRSWTT